MREKRERKLKTIYLQFNEHYHMTCPVPRGREHDSALSDMTKTHFTPHIDIALTA